MRAKRYNPRRFKEFIFQFDMPISKIAKVSNIPAWVLYQIHSGHMKDRDEIRSKIIESLRNADLLSKKNK